MTLLEEAIYLVENGETEKGLKKINEIRNKCTDDEKFLIAENYFKWGLVKEAKEVVEDLLELYPNEGELLVFLSEIFIDLDEEEQAISILEQISEFDPVYVESLLLQADLYQMQGLVEVSEHKLLNAKGKMPNEILIDFALGEFYSSKGDYKKSIPYYQKLLNEEDIFAGVNINARLAESLSTIGEFEEAVPYYEKAIKNNEDSNTLFGYGFTAYQAGLTRTAIKILSKLMENDPDYLSLYLLLAKAYESEGLIEECADTLEKGINVDPDNKELHFYLGKISIKLRNVEKTETHLRQSIAIDPGFIEGVLTLTKFLAHEERYGEIVECIEEVMKYGEYDPQFEWDLALAKNKLEQYSDALNHYRHAYTSFKDDRNFLEEYGYFLMEEGEREEAKRVFTRLLSIEPTNFEIEEILMNLE